MDNQSQFFYSSIFKISISPKNYHFSSLDWAFKLICEKSGYTIEYLKNDVGPKLWRRLSFAFGEKVNKSNVKIIITNRLYNEQEKSQPSQPIPINSRLVSQKPSLPPSPILNTYISESKIEKLEKIANVYCEKSVKMLRGTPCHKILMILLMFPHGALKDAIVKVAGLSQTEVLNDSMNQLQEMLLIEEQETRYSLNPAIKSYLSQELNTDSEFEKNSRKRWLTWYLEMAENHHTLFICEKERNNIVEVIDWCMSHNLYEQVKKLWPVIKSQEVPTPVDNEICVTSSPPKSQIMGGASRLTTGYSCPQGYSPTPVI